MSLTQKENTENQKKYQRRQRLLSTHSFPADNAQKFFDAESFCDNYSLLFYSIYLKDWSNRYARD